MAFKLNLRENFFRIWYWYVNKVDKNAEILFMNYGYHDKNQEVTIDVLNERNRYSIQLYHHLASAVEIQNKDIVEIGCGRGGGLSYIAKNFSVASAVGVDFLALFAVFRHFANPWFVEFCKQYTTFSWFSLHRMVKWRLV